MGGASREALNTGAARTASLSGSANGGVTSRTRYVRDQCRAPAARSGPQPGRWSVETPARLREVFGRSCNAQKRASDAGWLGPRHLARPEPLFRAGRPCLWRARVGLWPRRHRGRRPSRCGARRRRRALDGVARVPHRRLHRGLGGLRLRHGRAVGDHDRPEKDHSHAFCERSCDSPLHAVFLLLAAADIATTHKGSFCCLGCRLPSRGAFVPVASTAREARFPLDKGEALGRHNAAGTA